MKIKVSIQIIFKIMIIVLMIIYLPSYSHQNVKVFKAISTTEALQTSVPVTSSKKIHLYNTHQGEEYVGYNVKEGASYLKDCLTKEGYFVMLNKMILKTIKIYIELHIINLMLFQRCI